MNFKPSKYDLVSVGSGSRRSSDGGWIIEFKDENPSLIRADYTARQLTVQDDMPGIYRFADWLPARRILQGSSAPSTYRSKALARSLGMENLWITFSGWWPEKGVSMRSGTFKECEAYSVCSWMDGNTDRILVVASAGNTARAFARVCSENTIPLLLFVPEDNLSNLWFDEEIHSCVKLVSPAAGGDYYDAIRMASVLVQQSSRFMAEGGAKNIARRDGMGTTLLSAATAIGRIPDAYFQAVGSGTGAIAAWEAAMRLETDGRFGSNKMALMVSQNIPFTPMYESWMRGSRELLIDDERARELVAEVNATVLTNRRPPWGIPGGLYDALKASGGTVIPVDNDEAAAAAKLFLETEGIDVSPAAAVAVSSLQKALKSASIQKDRAVMLNITGGGIKRLHREGTMHYLEPSCVLPLDASDADIAEACGTLFD